MTARRSCLGNNSIWNERTKKKKCAPLSRCRACDLPHTFHVTPKGRICGRQGTDVSGHARCTVRSNAPTTLKKNKDMLNMFMYRDVRNPTSQNNYSVAAASDSEEACSSKLTVQSAQEKFTRDALQRAPHIASLRVVPRTNSPEQLLRANVLVTCESHGVVLLRSQQHSHHATSEKHTITQGTPHIFDATTLVNHNNQWQRQVLEGTSLPPTFLSNRRMSTTWETDEVLWL